MKETLFIVSTLAGDTFFLKDSKNCALGSFKSFAEAEAWAATNGYRTRKK